MGTERVGVWLSNLPARVGFDMDDTGEDDILLQVIVDAGVEEIFGYEVIETFEKYCREFLVPAKWINSRLKTCTIYGDDFDPESAWNEYPPGEPEKSLKYLEEHRETLEREWFKKHGL